MKWFARTSWKYMLTIAFFFENFDDFVFLQCQFIFTLTRESVQGFVAILFGNRGCWIRWSRWRLGNRRRWHIATVADTIHGINWLLGDSWLHGLWLRIESWLRGKFRLWDIRCGNWSRLRYRWLCLGKYLCRLKSLFRFSYVGGKLGGTTSRPAWT